MFGRGSAAVAAFVFICVGSLVFFLSQSQNLNTNIKDTIMSLKEGQIKLIAQGKKIESQAAVKTVWHTGVSQSNVAGQAGDKRIWPESEGQNEEAGSEQLAAVRRLGVPRQLIMHDIDKMDDKQRAHTMHSVLDNTDTICTRKLRMGDVGDGGWEVCDDIDVRPRKPCIVYSFGISNNWSFDDETAKHYGCHVYAFDPSIKSETHNRSERVHFYKVGIAGKTEKRSNGWQIYSFSDLRKFLGHQNAQIDVVKMDVENSEWGTIRNMAETGEFSRIKQFLVEFHVHHTRADALKVVQILEKEGFKKFYTHKNIHCVRDVKDFPGKRTICYEVHYVRRP